MKFCRMVGLGLKAKGGEAMTNFISECIGDIISIADGDGDDAWKLENANACADVLVSSRPQGRG
jgi:hypothetical protein